MTTNNHYAIIMAGGIGSRFWPISTNIYPKQFHDMLGAGQTLLQKTYSRLQKFLPAENILILTNEIYKELIQIQLPFVKDENIVFEPCMRNTAPCILYASMKIHQRNPNAIMIVAPSDHWIEQEDNFEADIQKCFEACENQDILMTLGVKPTFPNTGYGYIKYENTSKEIKKVFQFTEKPNYQTAKQFLAEGNYVWNAGIFIWNTKSILNAFEKYQLDMFSLFQKGQSLLNTKEEHQFILENYQKAANISIDYAIMEKSDNIYVYPSNFDWSDLGAWSALHEKLPKDNNQNTTVNSKVLFKNSSNNIVRTETSKIVIVEGLEDYIIVDKPSVLMIYPKSKEQEIKNLLFEVKDKFGDNDL